MTDQEQTSLASAEAASPGAFTRERSPLKLVVQLVGFAGGLALLAWCGTLAFNEENRAGLQRLGDANPLHVAALLGLALATLVINGTLFWQILLPVRRIGFVGMQATNALATFLSYLPFKLSMMSRIAIHKKRDGVPIMLIGPWFAANGATMLAVIGVIVLVSLWRQTLDLTWILVAAGLVIGAWGFTLLAARTLGGERGLNLAIAIADRQPVGLIKKLVRSDAFRKLDEGLGMLSSPGHLAMTMALRLTDVIINTLRFQVAASIVGSPLSFGEALIGSAAYFMISVLSPAGSLGAREAGSAGIMGLLALVDLEKFALIAVVVTGTEVIVNILGAAAGIAYLRPHRLIRGTQEPDQAQESVAPDLPSPDADRAGPDQPDHR